MREFLLDNRGDMVERGLIMAAIVVAAVFLWVSIGQKLAVKLGIVDAFRKADMRRKLADRQAIWWKARFPFQMVAAVVRKQVPPDPSETIPPMFSISGKN